MKGKNPEIDTEEYQLCSNSLCELIGLAYGEKRFSPKKLRHFQKKTRNYKLFFYKITQRILFVCFSKSNNMQAFSQSDSITTFVQIK